MKRLNSMLFWLEEMGGMNVVIVLLKEYFC